MLVRIEYLECFQSSSIDVKIDAKVFVNHAILVKHAAFKSLVHPIKEIIDK